MVNVVGHFPHAARGQLLRFAGHWVVHPKHGPQLSATTFEEVVPQSKEAIAAYLSSTVEGGASELLCPSCTGRPMMPTDASVLHASIRSLDLALLYRLPRMRMDLSAAEVADANPAGGHASCHWTATRTWAEGCSAIRVFI